MRDLTGNFVSQIDRLFTFAEMLATTGQTEDEARPAWEKLLAEGRVVEVRGAQEMHYRYRVLTGQEAEDVTILMLVSEHPGSKARSLAALHGVTYRTMIRKINRLLEAGKVERERAHYWVKGSKSGAQARNPRKGDSKQRNKMMREIWTIVAAGDGTEAWYIAKMIHLSRRSVYRYLKALQAEGFVAKKGKGRYIATMKPLRDETVLPLKAYSRRKQ